MPGADALVTITIPNLDGDPKDEVRFSLAVNNGPLDAAHAQALFVDLFDTDYSTHALGDMLANCLSGVAGAVDIRVYDITGHLDGSPHGSPYVVTSSQLTHIGGESRGNQLCAVIGYQAADYHSIPVDGPIAAIPTPESAQDMGAPPTHMGTTKLQSRHSGRMYLGPLDSSVIGVDDNNNPELTGTWKAAIPSIMEAFLAAHPEWCVWSRRNAALYPITQGWVDFSVMTRRVKAFGGAGRGTWA